MKKRKYQKFSSSQIETLISMTRKGYGNAEIAEKLGKTQTQVAQKKTQLGIRKGDVPVDMNFVPSKHKRRWSAAEILSLKHMYYKQDLEIPAIVERLGRTELSVLNKIRDLEKMPWRYEETTLLWGMFKFKYPVR